MAGVAYVNVRTAAKTLGVHENTIRNWCDTGMIHGVIRLPRSGYRRVPQAEVTRLLRELRPWPIAEGGPLSEPKEET